MRTFWSAADDDDLIQGVLVFGKDFDKLEEHFGFVRDKPSIASHIQSILRWHKAEQPRAAKF